MPHAESPRRRRGWLLFLLLLAILGGVLFVWLRRDAPPPPRSMFAGPVPVTVAQARRGDLDIHLNAVGTVTPLAQVTVRSRVQGELARVLFQEGQHVEAGTLLAQIDPKPYEIELAQARGTLQQTAAQLRSARADLARYRALHQQDSIARQQLDSQEAVVAQFEAQQVAQQAAIDAARLQLGYTRIVAPVAGRVGLRQVDAGNLIQPGDANGLVVLTQMRPISVLFSVPETRLTDVVGPLRAGRTLTVQAWDREQRNVLAEGTVRTVDNLIDPATGTLRLRAQFANDDEALFPNQFVNMRLHVRTVDDAVMIPLDSVQYGSQGAYVYVIDDAQRARPRTVSLGTAEGGWIAVTKGLAGGERVVLEGLDRLNDGREVKVIDTVAPAADGSAKPA